LSAVLTEFDLIGRYFTHQPRHSVLGVGDDAALIAPPRGYELAISADMLVAGRHFFREAEPAALGHKALAVNLSDLAAMGATPRWATLALALPRADARWLAPFARGFMALARRHGVDLIGGDTTRGPLTICVQIMGVAPVGSALRRDGANIGDDVWVSGHLGDAALAVAALKGRVRLTRTELAACGRRLHKPVPRLDLGTALRGVASSAIDISDGLLADLGHILERSRVAAEIDFAALPASRTLRAHLESVAACRALLAGGDDYELCFTAAPRSRARIAAIGKRLQLVLTRIGRVSARRHGIPHLIVHAPDGTPLELARSGGYDHFA
jgi:thiamine-monophosphate kinase